ncbi:MAG: hypothetical protein HY205_04615 [Nitrospirae bacterium]|nr:hypothetical protein [Nitrospirota bacterium]
MTDSPVSFTTGRCDACGTEGGPLMKLSLGKDFFGRTYDRLSPSSDQSPKWFCESCSMQKNLQRDVRDIRAELDKLGAGQSSELTSTAQWQRAHLRLREVALLLEGAAAGSRLLDPSDVHTLIHRFQTQAGAPSVAG